MSMGFAPTCRLRQVSPPPLLHKTTLTTVRICLVKDDRRRLSIQLNTETDTTLNNHLRKG